MSNLCQHNAPVNNCMQCHIDAHEKASVPAPGSALDDYQNPPTYRRWQFSCTPDVWALPFCITRYTCGGLAIQFLCFEMLTDRAHRWPNAAVSRADQ